MAVCSRFVLPCESLINPIVILEISTTIDGDMVAQYIDKSSLLRCYNFGVVEGGGRGRRSMGGCPDRFCFRE